MFKKRDHDLTEAVFRLTESICRHAKAVLLLADNQQSPRYIRLQVAAVQFVQPKKDNKMPENLGIDVPAGKIARVVFQPTDEKLKPAKLDGPLTVSVLDDAALAEVAVGGKNGLLLDIRLPDEEGSIATIEVEGDNDLSPDAREVISTLITVRRLGDVPGKAVSLGAKAENVTFQAADQFGVFPD